MAPTENIDHEAILKYNRHAWNQQVAADNKWTIPVSAEQIAEARKGNWQIVLTPNRPIPKNWFPDFSVQSTRILLLAGGGGQQGPILAAAGGQVTVFDNSDAQLQQDRKVAERDGLSIETINGDMTDLSCFQDQVFDLVVHPCSNCFVADILPVWKEAFRVLKPGGDLLSGFTNPLRYMFDDELLQQGKLVVRHKIPYSDLTSIDDRLKKKYCEQNEPYAFGHTLTDQIGGQIQAGFHITGFYEDGYETEEDELSKYIDSFIATRATRPVTSDLSQAILP